VISCKYQSFHKEIQFVQSIINEPDSIQSLIENSEYYDSTMYKFGLSYQDLADYLCKDSLGDIWIADYGYSTGAVILPDGRKIDSTKCIIILSESNSTMQFRFKEVNKLLKLKVIIVLAPLP
jgi:hypothetical protein